MNCDEARAAFTDLYDGALTGLPLAALSRHLDGCPDCRQEWAAFRHAMQTLKGLGDAEPSPGFAARVIARIEAPRWWERLAGALVYPLRVKLPIHGVALVALCLAGIWMFRGSPEIQKAAEVRAPTPPDRPVSVIPPAAPVAPSASVQKVERPPRPPEPLSEGRIEAPVTTRAQEGAAQVPEVQESAPKPGAPPPAVAGKRAEPEMAAPRLLRSAQAPLESPERSEGRPPIAPGAAASLRDSSAPDHGTANETFSAAATAFAAQQYEGAISTLRAFLAQYPSDRRAPEARFLLADAYRAQNRYAEASAEFATFLRLYPEDRRAPAALYRQGEVRLHLGDKAGCGILRDALSRHADAREAQSAREMLSARCP